MPTVAQQKQRVRATAASVKASDVFAARVLPIMAEIQGTGIASYYGIANALNRRGIATARGGRWHATTVCRIMAKR